MRTLTAILAALLSIGLCGAANPLRTFPDLAYLPDNADTHRLDLYVPAGSDGAPLLIFVHGGAFMYGDRRDFDFVGRALASQGIAVAVVSYRLFPETDAVGSTRDVAAATAWMIRHAAEYRVNGQNTFLAGHSAGAQIAAIVATDASYLGNEGVSLDSIKGAFVVAGAYDVRDLSDEPDTWQKVDGHIYGETPQARSRVSPSLHIDPATPPVVVSCGTNDDPGSCGRAQYFARALTAARRNATFIRETGADHMGMLTAMIDTRDPLNARLHEFIELESLPTP